MQRYGIDQDSRTRMMAKQYFDFFALMTNDTAEKRGRKRILKFLRAVSARRDLQGHMRALPEFVDKWGKKATQVRKMIRRRRRFLTRIFEREKRTMLIHYQGKKKFKKILTKLQSIKELNMAKIMDAYFFGVCY